jgi:hypothetical protein
MAAFVLRAFGARALGACGAPCLPRTAPPPRLLRLLPLPPQKQQLSAPTCAQTFASRARAPPPAARSVPRAERAGAPASAPDVALLGKTLVRAKRRQSMPPALLAAEVAKTNAEAAIQLLVLQVEQNKLQAEQNKLQAEQNKLQAEQNALEAATFRAWFMWLAAAATAAAIAVVLAADYFFHESPWLIKRRMRRMLLSFELPGATAVLPADLLKVPQAPLVERLGNKPSECSGVMLLHSEHMPITHPPLVLRDLPSPRPSFRSGAHRAVGLWKGGGSAFLRAAAGAGGRRLLS